LQQIVQSYLPGNPISNKGAQLRLKLGVVFTLLVAVCLSGAASATDYFVATWGDDSWPGTIDQPFLTITKGTQTAVAGV
jgi:hypothetical protein